MIGRSYLQHFQGIFEQLRLLCKMYIFYIPPDDVNDPDDNSETGNNHEHEKQFCCMIQLTLVFMAGFALSQFSTGFIAEKCGTWPSNP